MKYVIVLALVAVLFALGSAGGSMLRKRRDHDPRGQKMARALAWRVGLSVALFAFVWLAYHLGWIQPTGFTVSR